MTNVSTSLTRLAPSIGTDPSLSLPAPAAPTRPPNDDFAAVLDAQRSAPRRSVDADRDDAAARRDATARRDPADRADAAGRRDLAERRDPAPPVDRARHHDPSERRRDAAGDDAESTRDGDAIDGEPVDETSGRRAGDEPVDGDEPTDGTTTVEVSVGATVLAGLAAVDIGSAAVVPIAPTATLVDGGLAAVDAAAGVVGEPVDDSPPSGELVAVEAASALATVSTIGADLTDVVGPDTTSVVADAGPIGTEAVGAPSAVATTPTVGTGTDTGTDTGPDTAEPATTLAAVENDTASEPSGLVDRPLAADAAPAESVPTETTESADVTAAPTTLDGAIDAMATMIEAAAPAPTPLAEVPLFDPSRAPELRVEATAVDRATDTPDPSAVADAEPMSFDGEVWEQVRQAVSFVRQRGDGHHEVSLHLRPEELGSVIVEVVQRGDDIAIRIVTGTTAADDRLDRSRLVADLRAAGMERADVDISRGDTGRDADPRGGSNGSGSSAGRFVAGAAGPPVGGGIDRSNHLVRSTGRGVGVDVAL